MHHENLGLLADDASEAAKIFNRFDSTKNLPRGLIGISQAGWIIPLAASRSEEIDFMGIWSGPVCKISEEILFSNYTSDQDFDPIPSFQEAVAHLGMESANQFLRGDDISSVTSLQTLSIPGFWIFGADDGSIPVDLSVANIKKLRTAGKRQFEYVIFSGTGHNNIDSTLPTMVEWIKQVSLNPKAPLKQTPWEKLTGLYRIKSGDPDLRILVDSHSLLVERESTRWKLSHLGGDRYLMFIEGDGFHVLRFDATKDLLLIDEYDRYSKAE